MKKIQGRALKSIISALNGAVARFLSAYLLCGMPVSENSPLFSLQSVCVFLAV